MSVLADFLTKNTITPSGNLPIVHTTPSHHLRNLKSQNKLLTSECSVFKEKLNYFFVGRPAYKYESNSQESPYWELPCCFIFDFNTATSIKRVFPFDSGAFHASRYPSYISSFEMNSYESSSVSDAAARIVGAFFGDVGSYFRLNPKSESDFKTEFDPTVFDSELLALHRLSSETSPKNFDDRRLTVEIQSSSDIDLKVSNPLAVIVPMPYLEDNAFVSHIENVWKAAPIGYPVYKFNTSAYYYAIYERVETFLKNKNIL